jgi:hypothetical protein
MPPSALLFIVCQALANQGPLDVNGWPADGVKLNQGSCRNEIVEMLDQADPERISSAADFSNPTVCADGNERDRPLARDASRLVCAAGQMSAPRRDVSWRYTRVGGSGGPELRPTLTRQILPAQLVL